MVMVDLAGRICALGLLGRSHVLLSLRSAIDLMPEDWQKMWCLRHRPGIWSSQFPPLRSQAPFLCSLGRAQ